MTIFGCSFTFNILAVIVSNKGHAFLRISLELHRDQIPWRVRSATITGVQGTQPQWELRGAKPSEAECLFVFACPKEAANLPHH